MPSDKNVCYFWNFVYLFRDPFSQILSHNVYVEIGECIWFDPYFKKMDGKQNYSIHISAKTHIAVASSYLTNW